MKKYNLIFLISLISLSLIGIYGAHANVIGPQPVLNTDISKGTLFAKPNGSGETCLETAPCSIWTAVNKANIGDVVFLHGGTYAVSSNLNFSNSGTSSNPIIYESYPGETAVFDGSNTNNNIRVTGEFIHLRKIEVENMPLQGIWIGGADNILDGVHVRHSRLSGIQISANGSRNTIRNCIIHDNSDAGLDGGEFTNGGNADGVSISSGADNRVENCLVYHNSDDGIDTWRSTNSYVGYNIVHSNGIADGDGNGIKAGGISPSSGTVVDHNLSYSNEAIGITYNSGANVKFSNNTTWNNELASYSLGSDTIATNNISSETTKWGSGIETSNSWQRSGSIFFISTDPISTNFLVPESNGGFEDIGAFANIIMPLPDVVITNVSYSNGVFTSTVTNQGGAATPEGIVIGVGYAVNGIQRTWGAVNGPMAAGASVTIGTDGNVYTIPNGIHTITAFVDDVDRFTESNENNNQLSQSITVDDTPDVVVTNVSYSNGVFTSTVTNQGGAATPEGIVIGVGYAVNGVQRTWGAVDGPLAAGASVTIGTDGDVYTIPDGTHTIMAFVDDADRFTESNENNNQLSQSITVGNTPDVVVTNVSYNNGVFTSTVTNQGGAATPEGIVIGVGYAVNGIHRTWGAVDGPLAAGASVTIGTDGGTFTIPNGIHTITAFVDDVDRFTESNENNNQLSQSITQ